MNHSKFQKAVAILHEFYILSILICGFGLAALAGVESRANPTFILFGILVGFLAAKRTAHLFRGFSLSRTNGLAFGDWLLQEESKRIAADDAEWRSTFLRSENRKMPSIRVSALSLLSPAQKMTGGSVILVIGVAGLLYAGLHLSPSVTQTVVPNSLMWSCIVLYGAHLLMSGLKLRN